MSNDYAAHLLDVSIAQMCITTGWTKTHKSSLQTLSQVTARYVARIAELVKHFAELNNRTTPNMDDLTFVFSYLRIDLEKMAEYCDSVHPQLPYNVPCVSIPNGKKINAINK